MVWAVDHKFCSGEKHALESKVGSFSTRSLVVRSLLVGRFLKIANSVVPKGNIGTLDKQWWQYAHSTCCIVAACMLWNAGSVVPFFFRVSFFFFIVVDFVILLAIGQVLLLGREKRNLKEEVRTFLSAL